MAIYGYLLVLILHLTTAFKPEIYNVSSQCGQYIFVTSAVRLVLDSYAWPTQVECEVHIKGNSDYHDPEYVSVRFLNLNLGGTFDCSRAKVDILDYNRKVLTPSEGVCDTIVLFGQPFESSGDTITVKFSRQRQVIQNGSFDILATAIGYGECDNGEFECTNGKCVADVVVCDSYNNCGDNSDETTGCIMFGIGDIIIVSAIMFVIAAVAAFAVTVAVFYRQRTFRRILRGSPTNYGVGGRTTHVIKAPPYTTHPPPYQK
ncbi:low-density lipoprotein receptor-related protein 12-like [Gigantopelta aegis]|uniref:low-density lipoprotein receptor-related protein 12-like n=1 Tax=Gigantopelta aegis TaxID=1735272 RepID=UPI001B8891DD|nr:low-density lipoprotein receptor-related protein 12-like [Gigantopelta aegis]